MKKILVVLIVGLISVSCSTRQYDLDKMGEALKSHLRYRDADNGTITKIDYLEPISYEKIAEDQRSEPDEVYLFKAYIRGTWSYADSYRVFNLDDTIKCYFSKNKTFLRMDDNEFSK